MRRAPMASFLIGVTALMLVAACDQEVTSSVEPVPERTNPLNGDTGGIWISRGAIAALPTSGPAWQNLKTAADGNCGTPALSDQEDPTNSCVLAKALVFGRIGGSQYRAAVASALRSITGSGTYGGGALALGRELGTYAIAADLIDLRTYDPLLDDAFRSKLRELRTTPAGGGGVTNLINCQERRPNNWGLHCGATRAAIAVYLGDDADLARTAQVFKGYLGDRSMYAGFAWGDDLSWQCDPGAPVGINRAGCTKGTHSVDGVLADDQRRCGGFAWPPCLERYAWEGLQGALALAWILHRKGYDAFNWSDRALLRAVRWLHEQAGFPAQGDDTWQPHLVNHIYGTNFPAPVPTKPGKSVGWTDWTHQKTGSASGQVVTVAFARTTTSLDARANVQPFAVPNHRNDHISNARIWAAGITAAISVKSATPQLAVTQTLPPRIPLPPASAARRGVWISREELAARPTSGAAWDHMKAAADGTCGRPDLSNQDDPTNVCVLAKALVFARMGGNPYRDAVVAALRSVTNSGSYSGRALALGRELGTYPIAADLIDLRSHDPALDQAFRSKLRELRTTYADGGGVTSLIECHERRPNNWGLHCGATRAAIAIYLDDAAELARTVQVFKGYLGDRSVYVGFEYGDDLSWQCDPNAPVGINRVGCTKSGHSIDGVLPDDQRRCGAFAWSPCLTNYAWEGLQGALALAWILHRQGHDAFKWSDRALLRAVRWLHDEARFPAEADDGWMPHLVNYVYGSSFPAPVPAPPGKALGWTDWTHQR